MKRFLMFAVCFVAFMLMACGPQQADVSTRTNTVTHEDFLADAGQPAADGGTPDVCSHEHDAGAAPDASVAPDAGTPVVSDAGTVSAVDAGQQTQDAGTTAAADAGAPAHDAGQPAVDAGQPAADAGTNVVPDAGQPVVDAGTVIVPDAGTTAPTWYPAPFRTPAPNVMEFSSFYIGGDECGQARGDIAASMSWTNGPFMADHDHDGYLTLTFSQIQPGTYNLSYGTLGCENSPFNPFIWANYGTDKMKLRQMQPEARAFIQCDWWDAVRQLDLNNGGSCRIRITVNTTAGNTPAGTITGAGNMYNLN